MSRAGSGDGGEGLIPPLHLLDAPGSSDRPTDEGVSPPHAPALHADPARSTSHAHAHPHAHAHDQPRRAVEPGLFPHQKLHAYRVALRMAALAKELAAQIPRGHRNIADPLLRAASNAVLLLAMGIGSPADAQELKQLASRVSAMLTRLMARLQPY